MNRIIVIVIYTCITLIANAGRVVWALYDVPNGSSFHNGVAVVRHEGYYELMSNNGRIITDKKFKRINADGLEFGYCIAQNTNGESGIINIKGDWILLPSNKYSFYYENGVIIVKDNVIDKKAVFANGHFITPFKYNFTHFCYPFVNCDSKDGVEEVVNIKTEDIIQGVATNNGMYTTIHTKDSSGNNKFIYYDYKTGERLNAKELQTSIKNIGLQIDGYEFFLVNSNSNTPISNAKYLYTGNVWVNNRIMCCESINNVSHVFNESGKEIFQVNSMLIPKGPYAYKTIDNNQHYDYNGNYLRDVESLNYIDGYWYKLETVDGESYLYNVKKNKKYEFDDIRSISEGMIIGAVNGKPCYFNTESEKIVGPFDVFRLRPFCEGVAIIDDDKNKNERVIDKTGKTLFRFRHEFPSAEYFSFGENFSEGVLSLNSTAGEGYIYNPLSKEHNYQQTGGGKQFTAQLERKAQEAFEKKRFAEAQTLYSQIFELDNTQLWALSNYAACLINRGFNDEAIETCELILAEDPSNKHAIKLINLANKNIESLNTEDTSDEFESVANHNSVWNVIEYFSQTLLNGTGQHIPQEYNSFNDWSDDFSQSNISDDNSSNYQSQYDKWKKIAESHYNSLTNLGYSSTSKSGKKKGSSGQGSSPGTYTKMKRSLREAQREMRNIRQRARRAGINISQSEWETAIVKY